MNNHLACGCTVEPPIKDTIDKANDTLCGPKCSIFPMLIYFEPPTASL